MTDLQTRLTQITSELPDEVTLVAVSKFHPVSLLRKAYDAGARIFGESRAAEMREKHDLLPHDIEWHFIGHLQPNKVKYIAPFVDLIHSVDSFKLLCEIDKQARRCDRIIPCLLQLHVAEEDSKFGFTPRQCLQMLEDGEWNELHNICIRGVMCMATNTDDEARIHSDFRTAQNFYRDAKQRFFSNCPEFNLRSWGMSGDYRIAIEEGSNMVRIGSMIFGEREY